METQIRGRQVSFKYKLRIYDMVTMFFREMAISVEILGISFQMIYTFSNRFVVQVSKEYVCRVVGAFPE